MKQTIYFSIVIIILCALLSCGQGSADRAVEVRSKVRAIKVANESISQEIESFGSISFERKSDLSPLVEGVVSEFPLKEGSSVAKSQVLVRLRNPQLEMRANQALSALNAAKAALELAKSQLWEGQLQVDARLLSLERDELALVQKKAELDLAERTLKNKEELYQAGGITEEAIVSQRMGFAAQRSSYLLEKKDLEIKRMGLREEDLSAKGMEVPRDPVGLRNALKKLNTQTLESQVLVAQTRLDSAKTDLESAQRSLDDLIIRSPLDGLIGARYVEVGEQVQTQTKLVTIMQTGSIFAVFPVAEQDAGLLAEGMQVDVTLDAFPQKHWPARIFLVSPVLDASTGTVSVKARLDNPGGRIKPGMFARAHVILGPPRDLPVLPETAFVRKKGGDARIYAIVNGRVFAKEINIGKNLGGRFTVEKGLSAGELVVDSPSPLLKEGEAVDG